VGTGLWVELFGEVRAWRGADVVQLGPAQQRAVFALLALSGGRPVSRDTLVSALWGDDPPRQAVNAIQAHVMRLRRALDPGRAARAPSEVLARSGDGYLLRLCVEDVDALRFRRLVAAARDAHRSADYEACYAAAAQALRLWRAAPVADLPPLAGHPLVAALVEARWAAVVWFADAALHRGIPGDALATVEEAVVARPLDESLHGWLIRLYAATGRQVDALGCYEQLRRRLADELGVDPTPQLRELHQTVLRGEDLRPAPVSRPSHQLPRQLPAGAPLFTGRVVELADLDKIHDASTVVITAIDGMAGVGKTALAVQAAHAMAERYPDGQLFIDLHGYTAAAARLRSHPAWDLADLVRRLRDRHHRLVELEVGRRSVTAALDLSYQDLSTDLRRTYRLLGLHPGPDIDPYVAAALLDRTEREAGRMLEQLVEAQLLSESGPARYRFHDLTRAHAARTAVEETEDGGRTALGRLLDHYRDTASVAMDAAYPYERERRPRVPPARTPGPALPNPAAALDWLDSELPNLLAAASFAAEHRPEHLLHLSTMLHRYLRHRGRYRDAETLHQQALAAARANGHQAAEIEALTGLGTIQRLRGRHDQATDHLGQALRLARAAGHSIGQLDALFGLGTVHRLQGRYEQAADHLGQALRLARATGNRTGELEARIGLGIIHRLCGRYGQARDHYQQLLDLAHECGDRNYQFEAWQGLGRLQHATGHPEVALTHHQRALALATELGQPDDQARAHDGLAYAHQALRHHEQARAHWRHAMDILTRLGVDHIDEETTVAAIRVHLAGTSSPPFRP
jgi:DNA-binding SARP family transcriptional activator/tetratricopeptide (TPR) repeat protein